MAAPVLSLQASTSSTLARKSAAETTTKSFWHAAIIPLRDSAPLSLESMKSTLTLRPARPPCALMYLAKPLNPSTTPWNSPGASGVSTSASTAILISFGVMPMSDDAVGFAALVVPAPRPPRCSS